MKLHRTSLNGTENTRTVSERLRVNGGVPVNLVNIITTSAINMDNRSSCVLYYLAFMKRTPVAKQFPEWTVQNETKAKYPPGPTHQALNFRVRLR